MYRRSDIQGDHPVARILRSGPSRKEKLGLVIEGGGMRGVIPAGAALALEQIGLRGAFRRCYGSSAGAFTAAYFMAGQVTWGTSIFYEDLLEPEFFSWKRLRHRKAPMNLDFAREILLKRKPLNWEKASESVSVFATHAKSGKLQMWDSWENRDDFFGALRASATLPIASGGSYLYRGEEYFDAGVHTAVPWQEALQRETHLLVLLSRPESIPRPPMKRLDSVLARNFFARRYPSLLPLHLRIVDRYNKSLEKLRILQAEGRILVVSPPKDFPLLGTYERRRERLIEGARVGAESMYQELFGSSPQLGEMLISSEGGQPLWGQKTPPAWWL